MQLPKVRTTFIKDTNSRPRARGTVLDEGGTPVTVKGFCWSLTPNPTILDGFINNGNKGFGGFDIVLPTGAPDFSPGQQYYIRAYATNEVGTAYGENLTFTSLPDVPINNFSRLGLKLLPRGNNKFHSILLTWNMIDLYMNPPTATAARIRVQNFTTGTQEFIDIQYEEDGQYVYVPAQAGAYRFTLLGLNGMFPNHIVGPIFIDNLNQFVSVVNN